MRLFLLLLIAGGLTITSCKRKGCTDPTAVNYSEKAKKDDGSCNYTPFIQLNGAATTTINVGDVYNDLGAVANNADGTSVPVATDASNVNTSVAGSYIVTYSASNEFGTSSIQRTVNVVIGQSNWEGFWTVTDNCGGAFPLNATPEITAGGGSAEIVIDGMFSIAIDPVPIILPNGLYIASGGTCNATIDGNQITVQQQVYDALGLGTITYSGSGTMNATGDSFTIDYTYDNSLPVIGGAGSCSATYTK